MTEATLALNDDIDDSYIMVEDDQALQALCHEWEGSEYLAIDTEFIRTSTFFPQVGLIQLNAGKENYLVDPLAITDWHAFQALMTSPGIVKIFHSCSEDLQVFMTKMQLVPTPIFDTQIAGSFLNVGFGASYQTLVKHYLDIDLPKGETRSDWLQRPLNEKQLHYAALDVACLPIIYQTQRKTLAETGRLQWLDEECQSQLDVYHEEMKADFSRYYLNIKGAWQLDTKQLAVLQKLAQWRELRARKRDKPRNWIVKDKQLMDIAILCPQILSDLNSVDDLGNHFLRHEGEEVIAVVKNALEIPESEWPALLPKPLDGKDKSRLKKGQHFLQEKASELGIPVEMLVRRRWLVSLLQNIRAIEKDIPGQSFNEEVMLPSELSGWRRDLVMPGLIEAMR